MNLYPIRHALPGQKGYNNRYPGPGLGEIGKKQAHWIAEYLESVPLKTIWSSDFIRTMETAQSIQLKHPLANIQPDLRLRERQAEEESHESLEKRVWEFVKEEILSVSVTNLAVVAHGGSLNMILNFFDPEYILFPYPFEDAYQVKTPIAGIWEIDTKVRTGNLIQCPIYESWR